MTKTDATKTGTSPTAPGALPLIGHAGRPARNPLGFLEDLRTWGPVVRIRLGRTPVYVVSAPELVQRMLLAGNGAEFDKGGPFSDQASQIVGNGLSTAPAGPHRPMRALLRPVFARRRLPHHSERFHDCARELSAAWQPGQVVDAYTEMKRFAVAVLARTLFLAPEDRQAVDAVQRDVPTLLGAHMMVPGSNRLPTLQNLRYARAARETREAIRAMIRRRMSDPTDHRDLLSALAPPRPLGAPHRTGGVRPGPHVLHRRHRDHGGAALLDVDSAGRPSGRVRTAGGRTGRGGGRPPRHLRGSATPDLLQARAQRVSATAPSRLTAQPCHPRRHRTGRPPAPRRHGRCSSASTPSTATPTSSPTRPLRPRPLDRPPRRPPPARGLHPLRRGRPQMHRRHVRGHRGPGGPRGDPPRVARTPGPGQQASAVAADHDAAPGRTADPRPAAGQAVTLARTPGGVTRPPCRPGQYASTRPCARRIRPPPPGVW